MKHGLGAMIDPSYIAREKNDTVRFLSLDGIGGTDLKKRRVCLFYRKEQFLTKAEKDFIDAVISAEKERKENV